MLVVFLANGYISLVTSISNEIFSLLTFFPTRLDAKFTTKVAQRKFLMRSIQPPGCAVQLSLNKVAGYLQLVETVVHSCKYVLSLT